VAVPAATGDLPPPPVAPHIARSNCATTPRLGPSKRPTVDHIRHGRLARHGIPCRIRHTLQEQCKWREKPDLGAAKAISTARCGAGPICTAWTIQGTIPESRLAASAVRTRADCRSTRALVNRRCEALDPRAYRDKPRGHLILRNLRVEVPCGLGRKLRSGAAAAATTVS
jgi:hypothetical protein